MKAATTAGALTIILLMVGMASPATSSSGVALPPNPIVNGGVFTDGSGQGSAMAQCDALGQTCAGAAASAGTFCAYGEGSLWVFDAEFEICAGIGIASEASLTHLLVTAVDSGTAQVVSHFADEVTYGEPQRRCEKAGYVHGAVQENCEYAQEKYVEKVEPETVRDYCAEVHHVGTSTNPSEMVSQIGQLNGCDSTAWASEDAVCYEAEAEARAYSQPFVSSVAVTATNCETDNAGNVIAFLDSEGDDDDPVAVLLRDLEAVDQEAVRDGLMRTLLNHIDALRGTFRGGSVVMQNLMEGIFFNMVSSLEESLTAADFTVWVSRA